MKRGGGPSSQPGREGDRPAFALGVEPDYIILGSRKQSYEISGVTGHAKWSTLCTGGSRCQHRF